MPTYEITAPDGHRYQITAPEGASEQDVLGYAQNQFSAQPADHTPAPAEAQEQGRLDRWSDDMRRMRDEFGAIQQNVVRGAKEGEGPYALPVVGPMRHAVDTVGTGLGGLWSTVGHAAGGAADAVTYGLGSGLAALAGDKGGPLTDAVNTIGAGADAVGSGAKAFFLPPTTRQGLDAIGRGWQSIPPDARRTLGATGEIVGTFAPIPGVGKSAAQIAGKPIAAAGAAMKRPPLPTANDVRAMAQTAYKAADDLGGTLSGSFGAGVLNKARALDKQTQAGRAFAGETPLTKAITRLEEAIGGGKPVSLKAAQEIDEALTSQIDNFVELGRLNKDGKKLLDLQDTFRSAIESAPPNMILGGDAGFKAWNRAKELWSTSIRMGDVERIIQRGLQSETPATALRSGFRTLYNNPQRMRGFDPKTAAAIKKAAEKGVFTDILGVVGSRLNSIGTGIVAGGLGSFGGPFGAMGAMAAGYSIPAVARAAAGSLQKGRADKVLRSLAQRARVMPGQTQTGLGGIGNPPIPGQLKLAAPADIRRPSATTTTPPAGAYVVSPDGAARGVPQHEAVNMAQAARAYNEGRASMGLTPDIRANLERARSGGLASALSPEPPPMPQRPGGLSSVAQGGPAPSLGSALMPEVKAPGLAVPTPAPRPAAPQVGSMRLPEIERLLPEDIQKIKFIPEDYQIRHSTDARGVTGRNAGVKKFMEDRAGVIEVHKRLDGTTAVSHGHHRTDMAQRAIAAGQPDVALNVRRFREADGWTKKRMAMRGALQNLAEGSADSLDAAKMFKALGTQAEAEMRNLPMLGNAALREGRDLAGLSEKSLGLVLNGRVKPSYAAHVGRLIPDEAEQFAALEALIKHAPESAEQARLAIENIRNTAFARTQGAQGGLFGDDDLVSLAFERAKVLEGVSKEIRQDKRLFGQVARNSQRLEGEGNILNSAQNMSIAQEAAMQEALVAKNADTAGSPFSAALNQAAINMSKGAKKKDEISRIVQSIRDGTLSITGSGN